MLNLPFYLVFTDESHTSEYAAVCTFYISTYVSQRTENFDKTWINTMYSCWWQICTVQRWQLYSTLLAPVPNQRKQNLQKSYRNSHVLLLVLNLYSCKLHDCIHPMHLCLPREPKTCRKHEKKLTYSYNFRVCTRETFTNVLDTAHTCHFPVNKKTWWKT